METKEDHEVQKLLTYQKNIFTITRRSIVMVVIITVIAIAGVYLGLW